MPDDPRRAGSEELDATAGEEKGKAKSAIGVGSEDRPGGVSPDAQAASVWREAILEGRKPKKETPKPPRRKRPCTIFDVTTGPAWGAIGRTGATRRPRYQRGFRLGLG